MTTATHHQQLDQLATPAHILELYRKPIRYTLHHYPTALSRRLYPATASLTFQNPTDAIPYITPPEPNLTWTSYVDFDVVPGRPVQSLYAHTPIPYEYNLNLGLDMWQWDQPSAILRYILIPIVIPRK